jgi:hypothetical protein
MATYKLIQDIEAEDHILGPLTLRQFIFALITAFLGYICFLCVHSGVAFLLVVTLPPTLFFGFFALPLGRDQPTEVWALAKIRFFLKPRTRIWNQSGVKELVTITVPKKIERHLTKGFSQLEVDSRLHALADTIDSRGWAVKHVELNAYAPPMYVPQASDRLIDPASLPQAVPNVNIQAADDIMDVHNSPIAQQFQSLINQSSQDQRQRLNDQLSAPATQAATPAPSDNNWFMNSSAPSVTPSISQPAPTPASKPAPVGNLRSVKPAAKKPAAPVQKSVPPPMTALSDPAILSLAENDDLNVATLARDAKRAKGKGDDSGDEVVVSLH